MIKILESHETTGQIFRVKGEFTVMAVGLRSNLYICGTLGPNFIDPDDREWVRLHQQPLTPQDPVMKILAAHNMLIRAETAKMGAVVAINWTDPLMPFRFAVAERYTGE